MTKPTAAPEAPKDEPSPKPRKLGTKLKIGGIIFAIALSEWLLAYLYFPSSTQSSQAADATEQAASEPEESHPEGHGSGHGGGHGSGHGESKHGGHGATQASHGPAIGGHQEVDLGEFTVTGYQPVSNNTLYISFHLYGTIPHASNDEFTRRLEEAKHRIRDNVIVIIRSAEITDLTDAGLGLIKRRILETTNKTLGKPLLQSVVFSEFSFVEQ